MPFETPIIEPPAAEWPFGIASTANSAINLLRQQARKRLVDSAEQFVLRLSALGSAAGLNSLDRLLLTGDPGTTPIIMTGHQPVIFHSGLTFKYQTAELFAMQHRMIAVAIVIDTDEGDAGAFQYPSVETPLRRPEVLAFPLIPHLVYRLATLARQPGLFSASRLKSGESLSAEFRAIENDLPECCRDSTTPAFHKVAQQYAALEKFAPAGCSTMEANLIVRWNAGIGGRMLELPLSAICSFPEFVQFIVPIFERPFEFAQCYNQTLSLFRSEHRIHNEANPFPNLTIENDWCELPFWVVDHSAGLRHVLRIRRESGRILLESNHERVLSFDKNNAAEALVSLLFAGRQLVPRGALITATLRLLFSDLFVHGTGGGKYDRCTDELIRSWWSAEPSPFAVASASRFLFVEQRAQLRQLQRFESQLRDMQYNPQRFVGANVFPGSLEAQLAGLLQEREASVQRLKSSREAGASAKEVGREIQSIMDTIKAAVAKEFEPQLAELRSLSDENISAISSRTWPWFLFADQEI